MSCTWSHIMFSVLILLCRSVSKVHDEWFADEEKVRRAVGLLEKPVLQSSNELEVSNLIFFKINWASSNCFFINNCLVKLRNTWCYDIYLIFWQLPCGICFEIYSRDKIQSAACGHPFCNTCWTGLPTYITSHFGQLLYYIYLVLACPFSWLKITNWKKAIE